MSGNHYFHRPVPSEDAEEDRERFDRAVKRYYRSLVGEQSDEPKPDVTLKLCSEVAAKLGEGPDLASFLGASQPRLLSGGKLKDYQITGLHWASYWMQKGVGVILADEMGLGKTVQAIGTLAALRETESKQRERYSSALVVTPLSVVQAWIDEVNRFAPTMTPLQYCGGRSERDVLLDAVAADLEKHHIAPASHVDHMKGPSEPHYPGLPGFSIVVTTPEILLSERFFFRAVKWDALIIDEAHRLKNPTSKLFQTVLLDFPGVKRLLLTGTPLHNHPKELLCLMSIANPIIFKGIESVFVPDELISERGKALLERLHKTLMLRRVKADVLKDLPAIKEVILHCPLSPMQRFLYRSILSRNIEALAEATRGTGRAAGAGKVSLMNAVLQLRKCCNHPYMFEGVEKEPFELGEHIVQASAKLLFLDTLLQSLKAGGHRVLIFSQFTHMLDILQDYLFFRGFSCERLDGSVRGDERFEAVKSFQKDKEKFVFLLSTRAGGVGLTLTAADTVVFYDSDWNPQMDLQAQQRAHRIGQEKEVTVYRLICENTVEDAILKRAQKKLAMVDEILAADETKAIDASEVRFLIRAGAAALGVLSDSPTSQPPALAEDSPEVKKWKAFAESLTAEQVLSSKKKVNFTAAVVDKLADDVYCFDEVVERKEVATGDDVLKAIAEAKRKEEAEVSLTPRLRRRGTGTLLDTSLAMIPEPLRVDALQPERKKLTEEERQAKLKAKWDKAGYISAALQLTAPAPTTQDEGEEKGGLPDEDELDVDALAAAEESVGALHHMVGNVLEARGGSPEAVRYIVIPVDNSGTWGRGGLFHQTAKAVPMTPKQYEAAKTMSDLRLGDVHLIPYPETTRKGLEATKNLLLSVCIKSSSGDLDPGSLETCLKRIHTLVTFKGRKGQRSSVHFPQFGGDRAVKYLLEKLIKKSLPDAPCFMYYYRPGEKERGKVPVSPPVHNVPPPRDRPERRDGSAAKRPREEDDPRGVHKTRSNDSDEERKQYTFIFDPSVRNDEKKALTKKILLRGSLTLNPEEVHAGDAEDWSSVFIVTKEESHDHFTNEELGKIVRLGAKCVNPERLDTLL
jgi:superfamily II DNA or RNA helicase